MEKRDLILRMIEQTAQLFRAVFNTLPIEDLDTEHQLQHFTSSLHDRLGLDLDAFICVSDDETLTRVLAMDGMSIENVEALADILFTLANKSKHGPKQKSALLSSKALLLYQYVADTSKIYDWQRENKIKSLLNTMNEHLVND